MRVSSTVALSVGFVVLMVTGVLMFSTAYDYLTASLHIWSSVIVLVCIGLHFYHNWKPYRAHLKKRIGKRTLMLTALGILPIALGLAFEKAPFLSLVQFGESLRSSASMRSSEYTVIDMSGLDGQVGLELFAKVGREYESAPQELLGGLKTYVATPQVAVWLEDSEGNYLETLYVTGKIANSSFSDAEFNNQVVRRPEALPHWSHQRGQKADDGLFVPAHGSTEFDGLSAATPVGDHLLRLPLKACAVCKIKVEVNRTYDFNEYYSPDRFPDDRVYSGNGSSGQPSLVYEALVDMSMKGQTLLSLVGHGHYSGKDGRLYKNLEHITTAKHIFEFFVLMVK